MANLWTSVGRALSKFITYTPRVVRRKLHKSANTVQPKYYLCAGVCVPTKQFKHFPTLGQQDPGVESEC